MRLLHGPLAPDLPSAGADLTLSGLERLYAYEAEVGSEKPFVRANMVSGLDGTVATDGVSAGLSSPADKDVFAVLRAWADVVLVGAGTVRKEQYRPARIRTALEAGRVARAQPAVPRIAVVSSSLDLDHDSLLMRDDSTLLVTSARADDARVAALRRHHEVIVAGEDAVDLHEAVAGLHGLGLARILTEGGPSLLGALVTQGLVDDLCLSIAPSLGGGTQVGVLGSASVPRQYLDLRHVVEADGFLMTRYAVKRPDGDST